MSSSSRHYVRGTTVDAARRYASRYENSPAWEAFRDSLTANERVLVDQPARTSDWYDVEHYAGMLDKASTALAPDDPIGFLANGGRFVVDDGVNSVYRAFFRIASPSIVIRGSALLWGRFFRGSKLKVTEAGRRHVSAVMLEASFCCEPLCISIWGGMMSSLEHAGARNVALAHHQCRSVGGDRCEYKFTWQ